MPFRGTPVCLKCETSESPMWTNAENLGALCLNCVNETKQNIKQELEEEEDETKQSKRKPRATRSYKTRLNPFALPKLAAPKGRGRRGLFKKTPVKAPTAVATPVTSEYVFHKGSYIQVGDIVSMCDEEGDTYYAQITGLLTDQYCEKSAVITWLLPTRDSPPPNKGFDPATYIIGLEEDIPRNLDCMEFIMHAPSDYYQSRTTPYPTIHAPARPGFIWSSLETMQRICSTGEIDDDDDGDDDNKDENDKDEDKDEDNNDKDDDKDEGAIDDADENNTKASDNQEIKDSVENLEETKKDLPIVTENSEESLQNISEIEEIIVENCTEENNDEFPKEDKEENRQVEEVLENEKTSDIQDVPEEKARIIDLSPFIMTED